MRSRVLRVLICGITAVVITGCSFGNKSSSEEDSSSMPEVEIMDLTDEASRWADSVVESLTLRQKIAQMVMPAVFSSDDLWTLRQVSEYADSCIGGVVLLKGDCNGALALADTMSRRCIISPFIAIDAEWGLAMRLADAPEFPVNSRIGEDVDDQLMYDYGREVARECRILGINMVLGPVVDVNSENGFMRKRSFGDDPHRVADLALAYARGLEDGDVIAVAKHFPGHGSVSADSHKKKGVIERSLNELDSIDLYPFQKWVDHRLSGVMVGHLAVPAIDSRMLPAAVSPIVIKDLLRRDMGFEGLVLTDAINMKGAAGYDSADAVAAGADIVVAPDKTFAAIDAIENAVLKGEISVGDIDSHLRRILFRKYLLGNGRGVYRKVPSNGLNSNQIADSIAVRLSQ